jgi:FkbM family methyltransferase
MDGYRGEVVVLDVGCSGGIDGFWLAFGASLRCIGFDPLVDEIERLKADNTDAGVSYEAAFVGCLDAELLFPKEIKETRAMARNNVWYERTSARRYTEIKSMNYIQEVFNRGKPTVYTERQITVDDYCREQGLIPDFVKIDTDGFDIFVLVGAADSLASDILGCEVEAQFTGEIHPYANTFSNIERLMREAGFSLVDLETYRYSRGALPGPFVYDIAAQTSEGATNWGEAVYARDLADPDYAEKFPDFQITPEAVLKLASFYELYGLPDCAAEVLVARRDMLEPRIAVDRLLDALTPSHLGEGLSYREYVEKFAADPEALMPSRRNT